MKLRKGLRHWRGLQLAWSGLGCQLCVDHSLSADKQHVRLPTNKMDIPSTRVVVLRPKGAAIPFDVSIPHGTQRRTYRRCCIFGFLWASSLFVVRLERTPKHPKGPQPIKILAHSQPHSHHLPIPILGAHPRAPSPELAHSPCPGLRVSGSPGRRLRSVGHSSKSKAKYLSKAKLAERRKTIPRDAWKSSCFLVSWEK